MVSSSEDSTSHRTKLPWPLDGKGPIMTRGALKGFPSAYISSRPGFSQDTNGGCKKDGVRICHHSPPSPGTLQQKLSPEQCPQLHSPLPYWVSR